MAQTKNLGKVTVTPQGVYNASTPYERLDVVNYGGSSWMALEDVTGVTPSAGQYWMQIASKGDEGEKGDDGDTITVDGVAAVGGNIELNAVRYVAMSLTSSQQQTTRENIDAQETLTIDSAMSDASTNPVQNKVIKAYIDTSFATATDGKAPAIYDDATPADIVTVTDAADGMGIKDLVVNITAVQTGTGDPSPSNIRPISGWTKATITRTGKNIFNANDMDIVAGKYINNSGVEASSANANYDKTFIPVTPSTAYTWTGDKLGGTPISGNVYFYDTNKAFLSRSNDLSANVNTFSTPADCYYIQLQFGGTSPYSNDFASWQVEFGSSPTSFVPYAPISTLTPDWTSVAGTVYGGTIDPITGVLTVEYERVNLGSLSWTATAYGFYATLAGIKRPLNGTTMPDIVCEAYKPDKAAFIIGGSAPFSIGESTASDLVLVSDSRYSDATAFTSAVSGVYLVYAIETPQTYQLSPQTISTILGNMNVWADCGSIASLDYPCDTKLYIDAKTAALLAVISEE